jgi:hypothetical protein
MRGDKEPAGVRIYGAPSGHLCQVGLERQGAAGKSPVVHQYLRFASRLLLAVANTCQTFSRSKPRYSKLGVAVSAARNATLGNCCIAYDA